MYEDLPRFEPVPLDLTDNPPPLVRWADGTVRVGKTGVKLETVICSFKRDHTPRWIVESFPTLELADVHAVIAFYLRNKAAVDCYIAEIDRQGEALKRAIESQPGYQERHTG